MRCPHLLRFLLLSSIAAPAMAAELPDAPQSHVVVPATRSPTKAAVNKRKFSPVVEPDEKIPALSSREKLFYPLHEELAVTTPISLLYSGWYGVVRDNNPHFGVDAAAFGERVGAAAARQASSRLFGDALLPILLHQDPRYYRVAYGSYSSRTLYAFSRVLVTQQDDGSRGFNYSKVLGRGISAALTQTYYPEVSITPKVVFATWGLSLAQLAGVNFYDELWPDVRRKFFHR